MHVTSRKVCLAATTVAAMLFAGGATAADRAAAPGPASQPAVSDAPGQLPASTGKGAYEQDVGPRIDAWKRKVSELTAKAREEGDDAAQAAAERVSSAWATVQEKWSQLRSASAETWNDTKAAFESAWGDFREAWRDGTGKT